MRFGVTFALLLSGCADNVTDGHTEAAVAWTPTALPSGDDAHRQTVSASSGSVLTLGGGSLFARGEEETLTASGATPGSRVFFILGPYAEDARCPLLLEGLCVDIDMDRGQYLGKATADASGVATLSVSVPDSDAVASFMEAVPSAYAQAVQVREPSVSLVQAAQVCDPSLACDAALTCIDGELFPTTCGDDNCDTPIDVCDLPCPEDSLGCAVCAPGIQFDTGEMVGSEVAATPYHCRAACQEDPDCVAWDFDGGLCRTRSDYGEGANPYPGSIGGSATCSMEGLGIGLEAGEGLSAGESIASFGGAYRLDMQADGNLVLYDASGAYMGWSTMACGASSAVGASFIFQSDGNAVLYNEDGSLTGFNTETAGSLSGWFVIESDGSLKMYDEGASLIWYGNGGDDARNGSCPVYTEQGVTCVPRARIETAEECGEAAVYLGLLPPDVLPTPAGPEWATGCLINDGGVYFSAYSEGSSETPTTGYLCRV